MDFKVKISFLKCMLQCMSALEIFSLVDIYKIFMENTNRDVVINPKSCHPDIIRPFQNNYFCLFPKNI